MFVPPSGFSNLNLKTPSTRNKSDHTLLEDVLHFRPKQTPTFT